MRPTFFIPLLFSFATTNAAPANLIQVISLLRGKFDDISDINYSTVEFTDNVLTEISSDIATYGVDGELVTPSGAYGTQTVYVTQTTVTTVEPSVTEIVSTADDGEITTISSTISVTVTTSLPTTVTSDATITPDSENKKKTTIEPTVSTTVSTDENGDVTTIESTIYRTVTTDDDDSSAPQAVYTTASVSDIVSTAEDGKVTTIHSTIYATVTKSNDPTSTFTTVVPTVSSSLSTNSNGQVTTIYQTIYTTVETYDYATSSSVTSVNSTYSSSVVQFNFNNHSTTATSGGPHTFDREAAWGSPSSSLSTSLDSYQGNSTYGTPSTTVSVPLDTGYPSDSASAKPVLTGKYVRTTYPKAPTESVSTYSDPEETSSSTSVNNAAGTVTTSPSTTY